MRTITKLSTELRLTKPHLVSIGSTCVCHGVPSSQWLDPWAVESPPCCQPCSVKPRKETAGLPLRYERFAKYSPESCRFIITNVVADVSSQRAPWHMYLSRPGSRTPPSKTTLCSVARNRSCGTKGCWRPARCCPTWTFYLPVMLQKSERRYRKGNQNLNPI